MGERRRRRPSGGYGSLLQLLVAIAIVGMCGAVMVGPVRGMLHAAAGLSACETELDAALANLEPGRPPPPTPSCPGILSTGPATPADPATPANPAPPRT